jgi:hypothetical protein
MTFRDLLDVQDLMFRAYVRNMMFLATLPYHLAQEMRRKRAWEDASGPPRNLS